MNDGKVGTYIGIDPGMSGAIAKLRTDGIIEIIPMPVIAKAKGHELDLGQLALIFRQIKQNEWPFDGRTDHADARAGIINHTIGR